MEKNKKIIHPDFDGHQEKTLKEMDPIDKLLYLSMQIQFRYEVRNKVKRVITKSR